MAFTSYSPVGDPVWAPATINYSCGGKTSAATISLSTPRTISSGTHTLTFEVFQDPGRTEVMPGTPPLPLAIGGTRLLVWGRLGPQNAAPGTYTGSLTVTITSDGSQSLSRNLQVSMTLAASCVVDGGMLLFGSYNPTGGDRPASGTLTVRCSAGTPYTVALGTGNRPGAGGTRQMERVGGTELLQYQLYADAARAAVWDATSLVAGTAVTTDPINLVVYGVIPAGQYVAAGSYADTVQATINF